MLLEQLKQNYTDDIINAVDSVVVNSTFRFECLGSIKREKQLEILEIINDIYTKKEDIKVCTLCRHSELIIDEWASDTLCFNCSRIRNNRSRVQEILDFIRH